MSAGLKRPRWEELAASTQETHQCEHVYWDGTRCPVKDLPFGVSYCPKHTIKGKGR